MQTNNYQIERFLALSDLYFKLTGKSAIDISHTEVEEFIAAIYENEPLQMSPGQYLS